MQRLNRISVNEIRMHLRTILKGTGVNLRLEKWGKSFTNKRSHLLQFQVVQVFEILSVGARRRGQTSIADTLGARNRIRIAGRRL